jgi:hypothetical protein
VIKAPRNDLVDSARENELSVGVELLQPVLRCQEPHELGYEKRISRTHLMDCCRQTVQRRDACAQLDEVAGVSDGQADQDEVHAVGRPHQRGERFRERLA